MEGAAGGPVGRGRDCPRDVREGGVFRRVEARDGSEESLGVGMARVAEDGAGGLEFQQLKKRVKSNTQKELAEKIGVSASQLSRIVSGETRTVSSDILIGVAKEFKVSTDYILGLSRSSL